jgi:prevent-host-death family protein
MLTMTSLSAQNQFGYLMDTSQREPIAVTRRGRPVAVVQSYEHFASLPKTIPVSVAMWISENYPLRGKAALASMEQYFSTAGKQAQKEGMTDQALMQLVSSD